MEEITRAIFKKSAILRESHLAGSYIKPRNARRGMSIKLHPSADKHYRRHVDLPTWLFIILSVSAAGLLIKYRRPIWKVIWCKSIYGKLAVTLLSFFFVGMFIMYVGERNVNEYFITPWETLKSGLVYVFSGFEERIPINPAGWVGSIFVFIASLVCLGTVVGLIAPHFF